MTSFFFLVALSISVVACSVHAAESNQLPSQITIAGVAYTNVTWGAVTATTVTLRHQGGVERVPLEKLPLELQDRFGYTQRIDAEKQAAARRHAAAEARAI